MELPPERIAYVGDRVDHDVVPALAADLPQPPLDEPAEALP